MSVKLTTAQRTALASAGCEVRFDDHVRVLYATDASIYRIEPQAVAFPSSAAETGRLLVAAADAGIEITVRGAGTGLAGGAVGAGLVVDLAHHNRTVDGLDLEARTVRVGPGVVLDRLNAELAPHGLWFGPDVATSSRATLGGMIGNNSSGAHAPVYGTTGDHVVALEVALTDGRVVWVGRDHDGLAGIRDEVDQLVAGHADEIERRFPPGIVKRWPGYGFDRALQEPGDLCRTVVGSEGTLAAVTSAVLSVVPRPTERGLGVLFFTGVAEAMSAAAELARLEPAAVEHIDRILLDQTCGQRAFAAARRLLELDERPCGAMLLVEFFGEASDRLAALEATGLGNRRLLLPGAAEQQLVWNLRKAGLSLLTGRAGPAKATAGIEDVCVRPEQLPAYVEGLTEIMDRLGLEASYYGHAASGELHVRPILDLHRDDGLEQLRRVADEVSELCRSFGGSLAAEHGVGIARTEYLEAHLGEELIDASRRLKNLFDPRGVMNSGKIVSDGRFRIDGDLRLGPGSVLDPDLVGELGFVDRDHSFLANLEQCNGCGGCLKTAPTMCPTFVATGDEAFSTRGRANTIRAAIEGRFGDDWTRSPELSGVLSSCLSCKACQTECPSNVDLPALKAELVATGQRRNGVLLLDRLIAGADLLGRFGTAVPWLANPALGVRPLRNALKKTLGIAIDVPLPRYERRRFDRWFAGRAATTAGRRGRVLLWDDTWTRYHEAKVGRAAVAVLEALGFEVALVEGRKCCGRPAASRGLLGEVRRLGEHNLRLLAGNDEPLVFLEPSCHSIFIDEYRQLGLEGAAEVAARCVPVEDFVLDAVADDEPAWRWTGGAVAVHGHCHSKALADAEAAVRLLARISGIDVLPLDTGCCGMAGAFGMLEANRELSRAVARPLIEAIGALPRGARVAAAGTSCRHQIAHLAGVEAVHPIEIVAEAMSG
ncbi:MAG: FAD-linked oxidase C-terminal domain-containing protein [Thermoanaerobaculales bacterium]|jgi:FAD/FMN-containing dehydrogenase/Fe-S oxidoreductase|nr:FAD-linked oxidase C-terminal domain-containing protein [Thermoanaerobaculales bacterium]